MEITKTLDRTKSTEIKDLKIGEIQQLHLFLINIQNEITQQIHCKDNTQNGLFSSIVMNDI